MCSRAKIVLGVNESGKSPLIVKRFAWNQKSIFLLVTGIYCIELTLDEKDEKARAFLDSFMKLQKLHIFNNMNIVYWDKYWVQQQNILFKWYFAFKNIEIIG